MHKLIRHAEQGETFTGTYYAENVGVKTAKNGNPYTDLTLRDKSGSEFVRYWGKVETLKKGTYVNIACTVDEYMGNKQLIAARIDMVDQPEDLSDYLAISETSEEDSSRFDEYNEMLLKWSDAADNHTCVAILDDIFSSGVFFGKFINSPGGTNPHYGKTGGLLARTVKVADLSLLIAKRYGLKPEERIILLAGAMLHKIGAIDSFTFENCIPAATTKGKLIGTDILTTSRISAAFKRVVRATQKKGENVDNETMIKLFHAIASHSQTSSVKPMTKEAIILSEAFDTDSKMVEAYDFIEQDENDGEFTAFDPILRRQYYKV